MFLQQALVLVHLHLIFHIAVLSLTGTNNASKDSGIILK